MHVLTTNCQPYVPESVPQEVSGVNLRPITLKDKPCFDRLLADLKPETSDLSFTNLFMWQISYGLKVYYEKALDYYFLVASPPRWKKFFLPPIGDWSNPEKLAAALEWMIRFAAREGFSFWMRRTPRRLAEALLEIDPNIESKEDRNTFDYLYKAADLIHLAGRKYHAKKNHLNRFQRNYRWRYLAMTPEIVNSCLELELPWFNVKETPEHHCSEEEQAMATVLANFSQLQLKGGVILVDDQIQALEIGEQLNPATGVIHIEKANTDIDGIYAAINQQYTANAMPELEFINREEDMGIDGLRQAKLSYHPYHLVEKYSLQKNK